MDSNFTKGHIFSQLFRFGLPVLFALLLQAMYGAVDLLIVGQFSGSADVSATAIGAQIMHTVTNIIVGFSMGTTILMGQKIGANKSDEAGDIIATSIYIFTGIALIVTGVMTLYAESAVTILQAPHESFEKSADYVRVCSMGAIFIVAFNLLASIFRGLGNSKIPLMTVAIACGLNVFGDLILVAVMGMGAQGAALATVISQGISVVLTYAIIRRQKMPFTLTKACFSLKGKLSKFMKIAKDTINLGFPIAFQDTLVSISFLVIFAIVNSMGLVASAGVGVAGRLCSFIMLVPSSYMQSLSAFVAQNIGAQDYIRARRALLYGICSSLAVGIITGYVSFFYGDVLARLFAKDTQVIAAAADYLKAYSIDCIFVSFLFCFIGFFNGCGSTKFVMIQGIIGAFCVRVPVSYAVSRLENATLFKIGLATPASTLVQITLCALFFYLVSSKLKNPIKEKLN